MEPLKIVCMPADYPLSIKGSSFDRSCSLCAAKVMLAPSGQRAIGDAEAAGTPIEIVCLNCFSKIDPKEIDSCQTAAGEREIAAELASVTPNLWRVRN